MNIRARRLQSLSLGHFVCRVANEAEFKELLQGEPEATLLSFTSYEISLRFKLSAFDFGNSSLIA